MRAKKDQIKSLEDKIRQYEDKIRQYEDKIRQYENEVDKAFRIISDRVNSINNYKQLLEEKEQALGKLQRMMESSAVSSHLDDASLQKQSSKLTLEEISKLQNELQSYKKILEEKKETIRQLNTLLLETQHEASLVSEKERKILQLDEVIRDKDSYIADLEDVLKDKGQSSDNLQATVNSCRNYIASLEWNIDQKDRTIDDINDQLSEIRKELARIKSSKAFKIARRIGYTVDNLRYKMSLTNVAPEPISPIEMQVSTESPKLLLHCDKPDLSLPIYLKGNQDLILEGWTLSDSFIQAVEVYLDGSSIGKAQYGIRKNEIGRRYPTIPNSSDSGFIYKLNAHKFPSGEHKLKIVAENKTGNSIALEGILVIQEEVINDQSLLERENDVKTICTIFNKSYLPVARVLTDSFLKHNPKGKVHVLLVDEIDGYFDPSKERFELTLLKDLNIENINSFIFKYNITELSTAVKPYYLQYLFEKFKIEKIAYFDPDILVADKLDSLFSLLDDYSIILTPHILHHYNDDAHPSEVTILQSGTFNLGFIAVKDDHNTRNLLHWWKQRLYDHCVMDPSNGYHVDQKWMDLAPSFFDGVFVLREPGYNVAYWNLNGRTIDGKDGKYFVNGEPLYFFHFSGFDPDNIEQISRHQNRFSLRDIPNAKPLVEYYRALVLAAGYKELKAWPYAYAYFSNGAKVPDIARNMYRSLGKKAEIFGNPYSAEPTDSFFAWLNSPVDGKSVMAVSRLWYEIYKSRADLINAFPDLLDANRHAFLDWIIKSGMREHKIDKAFLNTMQISDNLLASIEGYRSPILRIKQASMDYLKKRLLAVPSTTPSLTGQTLEMGINLVGYFNGEFGVAEDARKFAFALKAGSIPHTLVNVPAEAHRNRDFTFRDFSENNPYPVNVVRVNADMTSQFFSSKGSKFYQDKYNIGVWAWELPQFPEEWNMSFQYYNELWAISGFIAESLGKVSPIPVVKITYPFYLDDSRVYENRSAFGLPQDKFVFLFMFDYLSVFERKNPAAVVKAFNKAFTSSDEVKLVIKSINSKYDPFSLKQLREVVADNSNIIIMDGHIDRADTLNLLASSDCYVSLHRSEGFGITMAEAMYLGKPVIATSWSGNMDFMNLSNSYLVKYELAELDHDYGPYKKGATWADPNIEHATELMQHVYLHREEANVVGEKGSNHMKKFFNRDITALEIKKRLSSISRELGTVVTKL